LIKYGNQNKWRIERKKSNFERFSAEIIAKGNCYLIDRKIFSQKEIIILDFLE
jgi:hypothetical protein